MKKTSITKAALLGSASALGYHWVYDPFKLFERRENGYPMIFEEIDHDFYRETENTYDVYPYHKAGDLDFMGEVLYITTSFLNNHQDVSLSDYRKMFYDYFKEESSYNGWVEAYAKDFLKIYKEEIEGKRTTQVSTTYVDKQLVGLLYILAVYENDTIKNKVETALSLAKTLTAYKNIEPLTRFLFQFLQLLDDGKKIEEALAKTLHEIPKSYRDSISKSKEDIDIISFVQNHAGIACGLDQSLPLIFYILLHTTTWEEAMILNTSIGGASANRGIFISAIASRYLEIPDVYQSKLHYNVK